jgi:hypothetical protein
MIRFTATLPCIVIFLFCARAFCADPTTIGEILDSQLQIWDPEITSAVEAMPADKFGFAPTAGVLGEKAPVDTGNQNEGPVWMRSKAQFVEYVRARSPMRTRPCCR